MANEITVQFLATVKNGGFSMSMQGASDNQQKQFNQTAIGAHAPIVSVGTSEEDLPVGDVATPGWLFIKNLDSNTARFVKYGPKNSGNMVEFGEIHGGEFAWLRMAPGATLRWVADTSAQKVQVVLLEN